MARAEFMVTIADVPTRIEIKMKKMQSDKGLKDQAHITEMFITEQFQGTQNHFRSCSSILSVFKK